VLLTPAKIGDAYNSAITRVAVTLNGKGPPLEVDVPKGGERRKVRIKLPQAQVVRRVDVKITGVDLCSNPEKAVGFAEVELQSDKAGEPAAGLAVPGSKDGP